MHTETCDRGKARVRAGHGHIGANYCQWQGQERKITILHAILATLILKINLSFGRQKIFRLNLCKNLINLLIPFFQCRRTRNGKLHNVVFSVPVGVGMNWCWWGWSEQQAGKSTIYVNDNNIDLWNAVIYIIVSA